MEDVVILGPDAQPISSGRMRGGNFRGNPRQPSTQQTTRQQPMQYQPDTVTLYDQTGNQIVVPRKALKADPPPNLDPHENPNAIVDTSFWLAYVFRVRPIRSVVLSISMLYGIWFILSFALNTVAISLGRTQPVEWSQVDPGNASQVAYWAASWVGAPVVSGAGNMAVEVIDRGVSGNKVQFVNNQVGTNQVQLDGGNQISLPSDSPIVPASYERR